MQKKKKKNHKYPILSDLDLIILPFFFPQMRKELKLPNLNCSSVEEMKSLQSQLEMITKVFELHNKMNDTVLSLNSADELAKPCKCNIWENVVSSPCDNDGTVGDRLYKERKLFALQCCA